MDRRIQELERALSEAPADAAVAAELARLLLRAGRPRRALALARGRDEPLQEAAGAALAAALGLSFLGGRAEGERFGRGAQELVLLPGGAFLDEGAQAYTSSLLAVGSRATLSPRSLPDLLVAVEALPALDHAEARGAAAGARGRLPAPQEWKKAWRGGLLLDGDVAGQRPNPCPDRVAPWGLGSAPAPGELAVSPYGLRFDPGACELCQRPALGLILDVENGRYHVPLETSAQRRARRLCWRLVVDLPPEP